MPSVGSSRVQTTGRGEIEYSTSNSAVDTTPDITVPEVLVTSVVGDNLGDNAFGLYAGVSGNEDIILSFKSLRAGPGITLSANATFITITATGNASGNGGTIIGDGFDIILGDVEHKGDGSWANGAVTLTDDMPVSDAIDSINEKLGLLIPAEPPAFPNGTLVITGIVGNTPLLASGFSNLSGTAVMSAGNAVSRIVTTTVSTNTFDDVGPASAGTLQLYRNNTTIGQRALTGGSDAGNYGGLVISDEKAYPVNLPGFWQSMDVSATTVPTGLGLSRLRINHTNAGTTADTYYVRDDMTGTPNITTGGVSEANAGALTYSSGIPHYATGATLWANATLTNLAGQTYYGGSDPLTITGTNSITTAQAFNYASLGITTPILANTTSATGTSNVVVSIDGVTHGFGTVQGVAKNVNGQTGATNLSSSVVLVKRGVAATGRVDELAVPVTGLGSTPNANFAVRILVPTNSNTPAGVANAWVSADTLVTYEAAVVGGVLKHDQTNYSTGFFPVGPNYSVGRSGAQYATFTFNRASVSTFKVNVTGTYAGVWIKLPGVSDNSGISPNAANGWWDATKAYNGAGVPGNVSDLTAGCAGAAPLLGTSGSYPITFGPESSTNATSNQIIVRIRLNAGQSITALSFTN
jgi:hypothetical protein